MASSQTVSVVTGATGFVASWVIKKLLEKGHHVRGTVRGSPTSERAQELSKALASQQLPGQLELIQADVLDPDTLNDALFGGATYVFHVASPFQITVEDGQRDLIEPAQQGTVNVLRAAARQKATVHRVVVTSSVCAIHDMNATQAKGDGREKYNERDWNEVSTLEAEPYWLSKVLGEKAAFETGKELGLDVVTILPNFVMGPIISPAAASSLSVGFFKGFLEASNGSVPSGNWTMADVRDVASAHVLAALTPSASGRYIVSQDHSIDGRDITGFLKASLPQLHIPDGESGSHTSNIDASRVTRELGLEYIPIKQTLVDMAQSLLDNGVVSTKPQAL